ncbi:MAG: ComF family protein [Clostridia bacterium]|nr:ComF family protein [Clostridia bacterium]
MSFFQELIDLFIPPLCFGCDDAISPGHSFCYECQKTWDAWIAHKCPKCGRPAPLCTCVPSARKNKPDNRLFYAFYYAPREEGCIANRMIHMLKRDFDRRLLRFLAGYLAGIVHSSADAHGIDLSEYAITYPPRARRAIRRHGHDHTALLARALGRELNLPVIKALTRIGNRAQKELTAKERQLNAVQSYKLAKNVALEGKKLILLDDVITSGATLTVCEALLYTAGAEDVLLCTLAKDI